MDAEEYANHIREKSARRIDELIEFAEDNRSNLRPLHPSIDAHRYRDEAGAFKTLDVDYFLYAYVLRMCWYVSGHTRQSLEQKDPFVAINTEHGIKSAAMRLVWRMFNLDPAKTRSGDCAFAGAYPEVPGLGGLTHERGLERFPTG